MSENEKKQFFVSMFESSSEKSSDNLTPEEKLEFYKKEFKRSKKEDLPNLFAFVKEDKELLEKDENNKVLFEKYRKLFFEIMEKLCLTSFCPLLNNFSTN